ncbi:MAG: hypothetical protein M1812_003156 [Candelaria pacifica]|nr:MAG: hypothetical protein M1812_003156 [Candelaria pacifica]
MRSTFAARRKAKRIGQDEDDGDGEQEANASATASEGEQEQTPNVKRLPIASSGSAKPKKKSSLRLSFGPGETGPTKVGTGTAEIFTPKKSNLSRQAIEKNAIRKSLAHSIGSDRLPIRGGDADDRPSYSKDYILELKSSTPSKPITTDSLSADENEEEKAIDVVAKFGRIGEALESTSIPTEAEIREKKQRRARLAHEPDFVSLSDDDERNEISLLPRRKKAESRLVREDEDFGEGFDEFVEDGRISLGKKAEREQERRRRTEMQGMIEEAENDSDDRSDESETERNAAYDAAQTRAGTYASTKESNSRPPRPKTPPKITPLPSLTATLGRLQAALSSMESRRMQKARAMEDLQHQMAEVMAREVEIQALLKAAGENYERLRADVGSENTNGTPFRYDHNGVRDQITVTRGLDTFGDDPIPAPSVA